MRILITGTNGLLGQHLVKLFSKNPQWEVTATARGENRLKETSGYNYLPLDISDRSQVAEVIDRAKPDCIIHSAAMTQVDDCEKNKTACWHTNVESVAYLIEKSRERGSFFTLLSTDFIFNGEAGPYAEDAIPDPISYYGMSKLAAEMLIQGSGLDYAILRTVLVYGIAEDMSRSNIVLWVKNSLEQGKKIKVVDDQWRTPTLVQDLAMGCQRTIEKYQKKLSSGGWPSGVFNISGKDLLTPYQMALKVADHFKLDKTLIERADASTFSQAARRPAKTGFILDKARKELGYEPRGFEEGLAVVGNDLR